MEQTVLKTRGLDLDMLGELEAALKAAAGDALVKQRGLPVVGLALALAGDGEDAVLHVNRQVLLGEAGDRKGDAIIILVGAFDIVRGVTLFGRGFQKPDQAVKTDGRAEKRRIVD